MSTDIGLARKHTVFVVAETTAGTLEYPTASDLILPAGNATINQTPEFVDSEELKDTLDTIDQFINPKPPGDWSIPMYLRGGSALGVEPQGGPVWASLQGKKAVSTIDINTSVAIDAMRIPFINLDGDRLPATGVITIESEAIRYSSVAMGVSATGTLTVDTQVTAGDTMVIGTKTYNFVANGTESADGDISVGTDLATGQANIVAAINGTDSINTANAVAFASDFGTNDSTITALTGGTSGNSIATTSSFTTGTNLFAATSLGSGAASTTVGSLTVAVGGRGYNSTTAAIHDGSGTTIEDNALTSVFYLQQTTSPSFSLWIKTDHYIQGLSGATASEASLEISNSGAVMCNFSGNGMNMVYAGTSTFTGAHTATTSISVPNAKLFSVGAKVYNQTTALPSTGSEITDIDFDTNTLTVETSISATDGDVISGYLPTGVSSYQFPIESKDTKVFLDAATAKFRTSTLTIGAPKNYLTDEVGTEYPEEYVEDKRTITSDFNIYFKKEDTKYVYYGYEGVEMALNVVFGDTAGNIMEIYLPKAKPSSPTTGADGPTMTLSMNITALGTDGEDSCDIIWR